MGAVHVTFRHEVSGLPELKKAFQDHQQIQLHDHGHANYSGHMGLAKGLSISSRVFKDRKSAVEWLDDNVQKYGPAIAVQVGDFSKSFLMKESTVKQKEAIKHLDTEVREFHQGVLKRAQAAKSKLKKCKDCESSINVKKMKFTPSPFTSPTACPVCGGNLLFTETDAKKLKVLKEKLGSMEAKFSNLLKKVDKEKEPFWLVMACVPE